MASFRKHDRPDHGKDHGRKVRDTGSDLILSGGMGVTTGEETRKKVLVILEWDVVCLKRLMRALLMARAWKAAYSQREKPCFAMPTTWNFDA